MSRLIHDERDGYEFISDNGILYSLLEGNSLGGETTSDIVFVMCGEIEVDSADLFVGWQYGADIITHPGIDEEYRQEAINSIAYMVSVYESEHPEIVKKYGLIGQIKHTVECYLDTNKEVLSSQRIESLHEQLKFLDKLEVK